MQAATYQHKAVEDKWRKVWTELQHQKQHLGSGEQATTAAAKVLLRTCATPGMSA